MNLLLQGDVTRAGVRGGSPVRGGAPKMMVSASGCGFERDGVSHGFELGGDDLGHPEIRSLYHQAEEDFEAEVSRHLASLAQIRKAQGLTQIQLARILGKTQGEVSRLENQSDLYLSPLRSYIVATGGELALVARFPDSGEVEISFDELARHAQGFDPQPLAQD